MSIIQHRSHIGGGKLPVKPHLPLTEARHSHGTLSLKCLAQGHTGNQARIETPIFFLVGNPLNLLASQVFCILITSFHSLIDVGISSLFCLYHFMSEFKDRSLARSTRVVVVVAGPLSWHSPKPGTRFSQHSFRL